MSRIVSRLATLLASLVLLLPASGKAAFDDCKHLFPGAAPRVAVQDQLRELCFSGFAVVYSPRTKTPLLAVEKLTRASLLDARGEKRTDRFYEESRLRAAERGLLSDYRGSGFDRGHLAAAANMPSPEAMAQSFSLANIVPQAPQLNREAWAKIEKDTRKYVMRAGGPVYVYTGVVFDDHADVLGSGVRVPSHIYKLVLDVESGKAWAHWMHNDDKARVGRPISYDELVRRTGIDFVPGMRAS